MSMQQGGGGAGSVGSGGVTTTTAINNSMNVVSEQIYEFLLTEMSLYAARSCTPTSITSTTTGNNKSNKSNENNNDGDGTTTNTTTTNNSAASGIGGGNASITASSAATTTTDDESMTVSAEMAAAKLERMGYSVGYRITERLAQNKTWNIHPSSSAGVPPGPQAGSSNKGLSATSESTIATATAAQQLEAVKFLCKEVWMEIFRKQIDKLQTNHRGVFVLKDLELKWLIRFPAGTEHSRISAIRLLAFPCGVIRGALANLGIPSVVSCDFLADGQRMAACSFNIKVK